MALLIRSTGAPQCITKLKQKNGVIKSNEKWDKKQNRNRFLYGAFKAYYKS